MASSSPHNAILRDQLSSKAGGVIQALDNLRSLAVLEEFNLSFPQIVVIGPENSGKSSVIERLAHFPLFPRSDDICTRMPIELRLVHRSAEELETLCVENNLPYWPNEGYCRMTYDRQGVNVRESRWMRLVEMQKQVKLMHDKFVTEVNGSLTGIVSDRLILEIHSQRVVNLRLIDLPGIIGARREKEPRDITQQTLKLAESFISQPHTLILAVASATEGLRTSVAMGLVQKFSKQQDTIGVLTKADLAEDSRLVARFNPFRELKAKLDDPEFSSSLVATRNHDTHFDSGLTLDEVLQREETWFRANLPTYFESGKLGIGALSEKLVSLMLRYTIETWVPDALATIKTAQANRHQAMLRECGPPPPIQPSESIQFIRDIILLLVQHWNDIGFFDFDSWTVIDKVGSATWKNLVLLPQYDFSRFSSRLSTTSGWYEFKSHFRSIEISLTFQHWINDVYQHWKRPFSPAFDERLFLHRFENFMTLMINFFPLEISDSSLQRLRSQISLLFQQYDSLPSKRHHLLLRLPLLFRTIFFEEIFFPAMSRCELWATLENHQVQFELFWNLITPYLSNYQHSEILAEAKIWAEKRSQHLSTLSHLIRARQEIEQMVQDVNA